ncbi:hypothetical protein [Aquimarina litoralis]|uniref:hypothetical protein n=1 Tax=Aquimarina litoralis TaxID=584605 RepID=UPI001C5901BE|nr:hypothetical protein [Aquimarina litoralis]MBW1297009.1 hypothetical protein [Aquimarina litoralis]
MPIFALNEHLEHYHTLKSQFVSPYNKSEVLMEVNLYKKVINTGLIQNIQKKPVIEFYTTTDKKEIPRKHWTSQMKKAALAYIKEYPILDAGKTYSWFSKLVFSTAAIGILAASAFIFYLAFFTGPQANSAMDDFVSLPEIGDKYYGFIHQTLDEDQTPFLAHGWIKIVETNPKDSTCKYVTSASLGNLTFDTLQAEHTNFSAQLIEGKFIADKSAQKISIVSHDKRMKFDAQVMSDNTDYYKITSIK